MEFTQTAANDDSDDEPETFDCLPRLPDIALRMIFSYLKFNDIKSCRQVCKQWLRHALDNVKFALVAGQYHRSSSKYRPDQFDFKLLRLSAGTFDALETSNLFNSVNWQEDSTSFQQFWADIRDALLHKIRVIFFNVDCTGDQMHQLVQACVANMKSAELLRGFNNVDVQSNLNFRYERDKSCAGQPELRLRELDFRCIDNVNETTSATIMAPFLRQAATLRSASACSLQRLASMLNDFQRQSNNNQPLVFPECTHLALEWKSGAFTSFATIRASFYNIVSLELYVDYNGNLQQMADFGSQLQQLSQLKHLKLDSWITMQLPELRLPSIITLRLTVFTLHANSLYFDSTSLEALEIRGCDDNLQLLASHARAGGLKRLTSLQLPLLGEIAAAQYLPAILKAAAQLRTLKVEGKGFVFATATCLAAAEASKNLESLQIGEVTIPREVSSRQFVQEVVTWHRTIGLQASLSLTCCFSPRGQAALATLVESSTEIDVDGTSVKLSTVQKFISFSATYDMAWRNSNGIQQKLRIRAVI